MQNTIYHWIPVSVLAEITKQSPRKLQKLYRKIIQDDCVPLNDIPKELDIPVKKVSSLKPYKDSRIYGIGTVNAQRNKEYRRRKSEDEHSVVG